MRVPREPSARRFEGGEGDGTAASDGDSSAPKRPRMPAAPLGKAPTQRACAGLGGSGGAVRSVVVTKSEGGSFGFRLTTEMVVEGFADGRAGAGPALAGMPIGWRIVAAREAGGGATVPTATLDEFAAFARACPEEERP